MGAILRKLAIYLCKPIYIFIVNIYEIFYSLANAQFFQNGEVEKFSANIYVLVSVIMLFAFSATLLSAIVNPDILEDKKKGIGAIFKRSIIGIILMIMIPFAFSEAYKIQASVMDSNFIEKVVIGLNFQNDSQTGGNGGQVIAGTLMASVLEPSDNGVQIEVYAGDNVAQAYKTMISNNFSEGIDTVAKYINAAPKEGNKEYAFRFEGLLALIAGLAAAYLLLLFAIDMAIRMFKLAFFELTAPISIVAYMAAGGDILKNWYKEVIQTYIEVFVYIGTMAFYLFLLKNLSSFIDSFNEVGKSVNWQWLLKILLVVGMLVFAKQIPNLISKIFKTSTGSMGSISSRLGQMAGVGKQVQKAWDTIRQHPVQSAGRPIGAAAGAIGNIAHSTGGAYRRTLRKPDGNRVKALGGAVGGFARGVVGTGGALKRGWKTGNLTALGNEYARDKALRPEGLSLKGQVEDAFTQALGYGTKLDRLNDRIARDNRFKYSEKGKARFYTKDELTKISSQYDDVKKRTQTIQDIIKNEIERKDSLLKKDYSFEYKDENGNTQLVEFNDLNHNEIRGVIESLRATAPRRQDFEIKDSYGRGTGKYDLKKYFSAVEEHNGYIKVLEDQVKQNFKESERDLLKALHDPNNEDGWKKFNAKGDDSNRQEVKLNISILDEELKNEEYAKNLEYNPEDLKTREGIERINTKATDSVNEITRIISEVEANRNARYTTDDYQSAERTDRYADTKDKKDHKVHKTPPGANDDYR